MPIVKCQYCSSEFYAKPSWLVRGFGKYCSRECAHEMQKNGSMVECFICRKEVYKQKKALLKSQSGKQFCSKSCQTVWRNSIVYIGASHPNWKGGKSAYRSIMHRKHGAKACARCNTKDIRVLVVHHIDRNRNNNSVDNLIWLCHNCHFLIHRHTEENQKFMASIA